MKDTSKPTLAGIPPVGRPATEKQIHFLIALGVEEEIVRTLNFMQAQLAIKCRLNEPTTKQRSFLLAEGVPEAVVDSLSKDTARKMISGIIDA